MAEMVGFEPYYPKKSPSIMVKPNPNQVNATKRPKASKPGFFPSTMGNLLLGIWSDVLGRLRKCSGSPERGRFGPCPNSTREPNEPERRTIRLSWDRWIRWMVCPLSARRRPL